MGSILGLGPQRDVGLHHLGGLCGVPACSGHRGLEGPQDSGRCLGGICVIDLQFHWRQHLASRLALVFRAVNLLRQLDGVSSGLSSRRGFLRSRSRRKSGSSSGATGRGAGRGPDPLRRPIVSQANDPIMGAIRMIRIHAARGSLRTSLLAV